MESRWHSGRRCGGILDRYLGCARWSRALAAAATRWQGRDALRVLAQWRAAGDLWRRPDGSIVGWSHGQSHQAPTTPFRQSFENMLQLGWWPPGHRLYGWHYPGLVG